MSFLTFALQFGQIESFAFWIWFALLPAYLSLKSHPAAFSPGSGLAL
jgi:hypothetical protein